MKLNPFRAPSTDEIIERSLEDAKRAAMSHAAAAEHHGALALMYRARIARLLREGKA